MFPVKQEILKVKDHFLTLETFELRNDGSGILQTYPFPEDIERYYDSEEYISHHQDKPSLKQYVYKSVQKFNLNYKRNILAGLLPKGSKVLDYGTGAGDFPAFIEEEFEVFGYEPSPVARKAALQKLGEHRMISDLADLEDQMLHAVTLWHVFEHLPSPTLSLKSFREKLKEGGLLIIAVPNYNSYDAQFYKSEWAAYDVPRHLFHYSRHGLKALLEDHGFQLIQTRPLFFDAFYISLLSEKYRKNPLFFLQGPVIGALSNLKATRTGEFSSLIYIFQKKN